MDIPRIKYKTDLSAFLNTSEFPSAVVIDKSFMSRYIPENWEGITFKSKRLPQKDVESVRTPFHYRKKVYSPKYNMTPDLISGFISLIKSGATIPIFLISPERPGSLSFFLHCIEEAGLASDEDACDYYGEPPIRFNPICQEPFPIGCINGTGKNLMYSGKKSIIQWSVFWRPCYEQIDCDIFDDTFFINNNYQDYLRREICSPTLYQKSLVLGHFQTSNIVKIIDCDSVLGYPIAFSIKIGGNGAAVVLPANADSSELKSQILKLHKETSKRGNEIIDKILTFSKEKEIYIMVKPVPEASSTASELPKQNGALPPGATTEQNEAAQSNAMPQNEAVQLTETTKKNESAQPITVEILGLDGEVEDGATVTNENKFKVKIDASQTELTPSIHEVVRFLVIWMASVEGNGIAACSPSQRKNKNKKAVIALDKDDNDAVKVYCEILDPGRQEASAYFNNAIKWIIRKKGNDSDTNKEIRKYLLYKSKIGNEKHSPREKAKNPTHGTVRFLDKISVSIPALAKIKTYKWNSEFDALNIIPETFWDDVERCLKL